MNIKFASTIKSVSFSISSNLIALFTSIIVVLIVPKLVGVEEYGYWQLYLFYSSFVGFLHLGWNDGIYLRYGGENYSDLDKNKMSSQFVMLITMQVFVGIFMIVFFQFIVNNTEKLYILFMTSFCMILVNTRSMLQFILQATNRIMDYAKINIVDRFSYLLSIVIFLFLGVRGYKIIILTDLIGKILSLVLALFYCREIILKRLNITKKDFVEAYQNINAGSKLMLASIASMLIVGSIRLGIENAWDIQTFGRVSLTLSITNFMMLFINAIGIVMFPILKRIDENRLSRIYMVFRDILMIVLLSGLFIYYPLKFALSIWLPKYSDSLRYMILLFPVFIFEGKMSLLINTYLKTLRKEKIMMQINLTMLLFSILSTYISTILLKNVTISITTIFILLALRSTIAEIYLSRILNLKNYLNILYEIFLTTGFIIIGWNSTMIIAILGNIVLYVLYMFMKRNDINSSFLEIKRIIS